MIKYGYSDSCSNEVFVSEDGRMLTLQSHPELLQNIILKYIVIQFMKIL